MDQQAELETKRREVREEILAMKEAIPTARILNFFGKAFPKQSTGYWLANFLAFNIIGFVPWLSVGWVMDELTSTPYLLIPGIWFVQFSTALFFISNSIAFNIFDEIANCIVVKINNVEDLSGYIQWHRKSWTTSSVMRYAISWTVFWSILGVVGFRISYGNFVGLGFLITILLGAVLIGIVFYLIFWIGSLAKKLGQYEYELNTFSPADSEIIHNISDMLMRCIYILAFIFAIMTLVVSSNVIALDEQMGPLFGTPLLLVAWTASVIQFLFTRSTIEKIVAKAKWKTLNKLQVKINSIESTGDLSDKETSERLLRLADMHKQILASKTNSFDFKSVATLFSQLMLPLLGLLLGNLDKILALLS